MDDTPITVLLIEDNPGDVALIRSMLGRQPFALESVSRLADGLDRLDQGDIDFALVDLSLPDSEGLDTLTRVREHAPTLPVVVLTGTDDEALGLEAVQKGAQDYLVKGQTPPALLTRAIRYGIERKQTEEKIRALNADLERRVAERTRELEAAYQELQTLDRLKTAFIDIITHELTTPLTVAGGMLTLGRRQVPEEQARLARTLDTAARAVQRLQDLLDQMLEVAEAGDFATVLRREPTPPARLAASVASIVAPFLELRGQRLDSQVPETLPPVPVEAGKIRDALLNLVMNAIKFTPDGGTITLSARRVDDAVEFRVTDTGIGIPEAEQPHVFERFFTTFDTIHHSTGSYEFGKRGMGIGLAIVKSFVEMHGGSVGVESTPGEGSTFWFTLPL
ncbi:MAG: ATP-binding protein [Planctomycetota bacterium]